MQAGNRVRYVTGTGKKLAETTATVVEVTGTGASLYKVLSLLVDGAVVEKVPHENDAEAGEAHWRETGAAARQEQALPEPVPGGGVPSGEPVLPAPPVVPEEAPRSAPSKRGGK